MCDWPLYLFEDFGLTGEGKKWLLAAKERWKVSQMEQLAVSYEVKNSFKSQLKKSEFQALGPPFELSCVVSESCLAR